MTVLTGGTGGLARIGNSSLPGGRGNRLNEMERVQIMRLRDAGLNDAQIAHRIGRHRSTVGREIAGNSNADGDYHGLLKNNPLGAEIEAWMDQGWSPKLIAEVLARDHLDDRLMMRVSHETIYRCLGRADPWQFAC